MPSERTINLLKDIEGGFGPDSYDEYYDTISGGLGGKPRYYDREGSPITFRQWAMLWDAIPFDEYRRIAYTDVGPYYVSTVWLGLDHSYFKDRPPLIFESMVFASDLTFHEGVEEFKIPPYEFHESFEEQRYSTEEQAILGHNALVESIKRKAEEQGIELDRFINGGKDE